MKILARANKKLRGNGKFYAIPEPTKSWFYVTEYDSNGYPIKAKTIGCSGDMPFIYMYGGSSNNLNIITQSLQEFEINDGVTNIGNYAFQFRTKLKSIKIPKTITRIENSAFSGCTGLTSFPILNDLSFIGQMAFSSCNKLTSFNFGNGNISIGQQCFQDCTNLASVTFGSGNISIGTYAFNYCSNLVLFDFRNATQVPTLSSTNAFQGTPSSKKIVVPDALYDEWITATNWSSTTNNIVSSIIKASDYEASL